MAKGVKKGYRFSEEEKKQISINVKEALSYPFIKSKMRKPKTAEHRANISKSMKKYWSTVAILFMLTVSLNANPTRINEWRRWSLEPNRLDLTGRVFFRGTSPYNDGYTYEVYWDSNMTDWQRGAVYAQFHNDFGRWLADIRSDGRIMTQDKNTNAREIIQNSLYINSAMGIAVYSTDGNFASFRVRFVQN